MNTRSSTHFSRASVLALALTAGLLAPSLACAQHRAPAAPPPPPPSAPPPAAAPQRESDAERRERQERLARELDEMEQQLQRAARAAGQTAEELARRAGEGVDQAQRELRESMPEIQKQVEKLQRSLEDFEGALSAQARSARGVVRGVSANEIQVEDSTGQIRSFRTDERTYVLLGDEELGREALEPGTPVRVTFVLRDQRHVAREIEVVRR